MVEYSKMRNTKKCFLYMHKRKIQKVLLYFKKTESHDYFSDGHQLNGISIKHFMTFILCLYM